MNLPLTEIPALASLLAAVSDAVLKSTLFLGLTGVAALKDASAETRQHAAIALG